MAEQKGLGSKFLGLFVEKEGDGAAPTDSDLKGDDTGDAGKSAADLVAELARESDAHAKAPRPPGGSPQSRAAGGAGNAAGAPGAAAPPLPSNLKLDKLANAPPTNFDVIFKDAGMDAAELDRVNKAEELLKGLPEDAPVAMKRKIVETSLRTFGFDVEKIVQAANNQKRALDTYVRVNEGATQKSSQDAQTQIKQLEEKIIGLKAEIDKRTQQLTEVKAAAEARKAQVQQVLEFFAQPGAAAAPVTPGTPPAPGKK